MRAEQLSGSKRVLIWETYDDDSLTVRLNPFFQAGGARTFTVVLTTNK